MPILEVSYQQLLKGVKHLNPSDLERFTKDILSIKAERRTDTLSENETDLLEKINQSLPTELRLRYKLLIAKKEAETLTNDEYHELLDITEQKEGLNVERIRYLIQLAVIRKTSLSDLVDQLGV